MDSILKRNIIDRINRIFRIFFQAFLKKARNHQSPSAIIILSISFKVFSLVYV